MIAKTRFTLMAVTVFTVLALSVVMTVPAFADDSAPPPPVDTPTEVVPPVDEPAVVDAPPAEEVVPAEAAPSEAAPVEAAPADAAPVDATTVTEVLAQTPEGTDVQVVDENGVALPLASQEAADVVAAGDPIWCPSGVATPVSGGSGCTTSFSSFEALRIFLLANQPAEAGTIWIEKTYNSSTNDTGVTSFLLDGGAGIFDIMANYALTIKGGWDGIGTSTVDVNDKSEFNGASLSIINWKANVSLSDILVNLNITNTGSADSALLVTTTGNIQLDRVTVKLGKNNGAGVMAGATLNNSTSTTASTVIVNNGIFQENEGNGLYISSVGGVALSNVIADLNNVGGVSIDNSTAASDQAVTLSGTQQYHNNANGHGLLVKSRGYVSISNVIANANAGDGVRIDNSTSSTNQGVTVGGMNTFNDNANGLYVLSHGIITTSYLSASTNGADGVHLDNCDGDPTCSVPGAPYINVTGDNYFNYNKGHGLFVSSFGQIMTNNLSASCNGYLNAIGNTYCASPNVGNEKNGAYLKNQWNSLATGLPVESSGSITLNGTNFFNNNSLDGLYAASNDNFVAYGLTASDNGNSGAVLNVQKNVPTLYSYLTRIKVKGKYKNVINYYYVYDANIALYGTSNFERNKKGDGLKASADGSITLYGINANYNGDDSVDDGADLTTTTEGYGISLYNTNNLSGNIGMGLRANSKGAVTLYNISANDNTGNGVDVDNRASSGNQGVNLYGATMVNGNSNGLKVMSHGIITTYNLSASENDADGVNLNNCDATTTPPFCDVIGAPYVYMLGSNYFHHNGGDGLDVSSFGAMYTYNLTATDNIQNGARLNNQKLNNLSVESVGIIALYGINIFSRNGVDGLNAVSSNDIVAYDLTANQNGVNGVSLTVKKDQPTLSYYYTVVKTKVKGKYKTVYVVNYYYITAANVSLYGTNSFVGNKTGDGLKVSSDGAITVYNLTATGNGINNIPSVLVGNGATLDNCNSCAAGTEVYPVTIYGYVNVSGNHYRGLQVYSLGAVTLSNISASGNKNVGVHIDNKFNPSIDPAVVRGVTISGTNTFNYNDSTGLVINSYGAIALTNINASYNGDSSPGSSSGVRLDNSFNRDPAGPEGLITAKNITITGVNSFVGNYWYGLEFISNGLVTLTSISANGNDYGSTDGNIGAGVKGTAQSITLTCGHMFGNGNADAAVGYDLRVGLGAAGSAVAVPGVLTLNGIYSAGNQGADVNVNTAGTSVAGSTQVITQACALP